MHHSNQMYASTSTSNIKEESRIILNYLAGLSNASLSLEAKSDKHAVDAVIVLLILFWCLDQGSHCHASEDANLAEIPSLQ